MKAQITPRTTVSIVKFLAVLVDCSALCMFPLSAALFALHAATIAHIPVGQKQQRHAKIAGINQFDGLGWAVVTIMVEGTGCATTTVCP